ncbi:MAG: hypothetical protein M1829_004073 [Trizodia sp. TS-e1964]|nr:MAG: hypothetical protein M1829_004073 [Trizodia sp. TS-e1964]
MPTAVMKPTKNQLRRAKKRAQKAELEVTRPTQHGIQDVDLNQSKPPPIKSEAESESESDLHAQQKKPVENGASSSPAETLNLAGNSENFEITEDDPNYEMFQAILAKFGKSDDDAQAERDAKAGDKGEVFYDDDADIPDEDEEAENGEVKLSKKARKAQNKLSVAELKALVRKPETVDWTDTSASDPRLLVHIKSYRNVVPVPAHWSLKREYLSSKRGVEKAPFALPKFIQETGIAEMRDAVLEKQDQASLKQKQRERVQPKMGKLDIDYQKLYEAFFRFQTKPELTRYGEVYYEGKEYETNLRHLRPGELSEDLKEALNIPPGAPPPWLINQQRYGPPPSYPSLKIPGLNAPPPPGGVWGFQPGGYGKPPVDEFSRPLYGGDIFGNIQPLVNSQLGEPVEKTLWGELQEPEEESEEEESEDEDEDESMEDDIGAGLQTPSGFETPGGVASTVPSEYGGEMSVGGDFDLRKYRKGTETEESTHPRTAGVIVPEKQIRSQGFFGGEHAYDLRAAQQNPGVRVLDQEDNSRKRKKPGDVDVAINPDSLLADDGLSKEEIKRRFEAQKKEENSSWGGVFQEDLSDMIASESRKRAKREEERKGGGKDKKERGLQSCECLGLVIVIAHLPEEGPSVQGSDEIDLLPVKTPSGPTVIKLLEVDLHNHLSILISLQPATVQTSSQDAIVLPDYSVVDPGVRYREGTDPRLPLMGRGGLEIVGVGHREGSSLVGPKDQDRRQEEGCVQDRQLPYLEHFHHE